MRIISKYKDYYDGVVAHGADRELCYVRDTRELSKDEFIRLDSFRAVKEKIVPLYGKMNVALERAVLAANSNKRTARTQLESKNFDQAIIGFCGKLYPVFSFMDEWFVNTQTFLSVLKKLNQPANDDYVIRGGQSNVLVSIEEYKSILAQFESDTREPAHKDNYNRALHKLTRVWLEKFNETYDDGVAVQLDYFFDINAPVFIWLSGHGRRDYKQSIIVNPHLVDYKFQSLVDPFTAWQEISMFVGGVLNRPENKMVSVSDEIRRDKKGFDDRSFKNMPGRD